MFKANAKFYETLERERHGNSERNVRQGSCRLDLVQIADRLEKAAGADRIQRTTRLFLRFVKRKSGIDRKEDRESRHRSTEKRNRQVYDHTKCTDANILTSIRRGGWKVLPAHCLRAVLPGGRKRLCGSQWRNGKYNGALKNC